MAGTERAPEEGVPRWGPSMAANRFCSVVNPCHLFITPHFKGRFLDKVGNGGEILFILYFFHRTGTKSFAFRVGHLRSNILFLLARTDRCGTLRSCQIPEAAAHSQSTLLAKSFFLKGDVENWGTPIQSQSLASEPKCGSMAVPPSAGAPPGDAAAAEGAGGAAEGGPGAGGGAGAAGEGVREGEGEGGAARAAADAVRLPEGQQAGGRPEGRRPLPAA